MYLSKLLYLHPSQNQEVEASELRVCNWFVEEFGVEFNFFDDTYFIQDIENKISRVSVTIILPKLFKSITSYFEKQIPAENRGDKSNLDNAQLINGIAKIIKNY